MKKSKLKVIVAMSGGVDSSVAAALLKKQGFEVAGIFMRFWSEKGNRSNACCSAGAEAAARSVAAKLKIPFYVLNFAKEFKTEVVDYFLGEQARGRTPNPCVVCNKKIKFGLLFKKALGLGADFLATGHYAQIKKSKIKNVDKNLKFIFKLCKAKDNSKDQSYFLYTLNQAQLSRIIFPLDGHTKDEVYKLAKKWGLPYRKEESFDLCFVANDAESFVRKYLKLKSGKILNLGGAVLGQHDGLALYTIGQRKSIPVPNGPWWVVRKEERKNILFVSNNEKDLYAKELIMEKINWISGQVPALPVKVWVKIRYKSEAGRAVVAVVNGIVARPVRHGGRGARNDFLKVIFKKPQRAITPGQSAVFYAKSGEVLGGGVIKSCKCVK